MAKSKLSSQAAHGALHPGVTRVIARSLMENFLGRSVATITVETVDGLIHTFKADLDDEAKAAIKAQVERLLGHIKEI